MASIPDLWQRKLTVQMKLRRRAPNTITTKTALRNELAHVHGAGFAVDDQELDPGLYAIAAPVRNESGEVVAAVDLIAHSDTTTINELLDAHLPQLINTADRISARLGFRHDDELLGGGRQ